MKLSSIIVGALATVATAAPAKVDEEKRSFDNSFDSFDNGFDSFDNGFDSFDNGLNNVGGFGGGFGNAFDVGLGAAGLAPLAIGFGVPAISGNIFNAGFAGSLFNNFQIQNSQIAFLLGANSFDFNTLFTFLDLGFPVQAISGLFNFGAGNVLDVQSLLGVNNLLVFQWFMNQFGQDLFFSGGFGGFNGLQLPFLDFGVLSGAGLGLQSQFLIDNSLFDANVFNSFADPFLTGNIGFDAFQQFNFANLGAAGVLKE